MKVLHLLRTSAYNTPDLSECLATFQPNDQLVLLDDGCYNLTHVLLNEFIENNGAQCVSFIKDHATARAMETNSKSNVNAINLDTLVNLTFECDSVITWQ